MTDFLSSDDTAKEIGKANRRKKGYHSIYQF